MKKLALNLLKSADEKIRSISKQPGGKPASPSGPEPPHQEGDNMAERRIQQRQGRRDRFRANEGGRADQAKTEVKRRSRSEGPTNRVSRVTQSIEEGRPDDFASYGKKNEKIVGPIWAVTHSSTATRVSRYSPPLSDDGSLIHVHQPASDSDSYDSDTKVWRKNPLVVRKTRKTGRSEKRQSSHENGFSTGIPVKDSFVYYGSQDKGDSGGNGSNLKGNKYQKLEELRRKRIDIQMTSDEENTPESRISRLRQRAIQGGLGKQPRPESFRQNMPGSPIQNYSPKSQGAFFQNGSSDPRSNAANQPNVRSSVIQSSTYQSVNGAPTSSAYGSSYGNKQTNQNNAQNRQSLIRPFDTQGLSDSGIFTRSDVPANFNRFSQHAEPRSPVPKTAVYSSSPEPVVRRPFDRPRVQSVDSIYEGANNQDQQVAPTSPGRDYSKKYGSGNTYQNVGHGFVFMRPASSGTMEVPKGELVKAPVPAQRIQNARPQSNFNEAVEMRLASSRPSDRQPSQSLIDQQRRLRANIVANSDDSLDELIESNIQYLESEIESGRAKKGLAPVSRSSSLPDPRRSSGIMTSAHQGPLHSGVLPPSFIAAQKTGSTRTIPTQPHVKAGSELKYHIPIAGTRSGPPEILIASENRFSTDYTCPPPHNHGNSSFLSQPTHLYGQPIERKHSYDSRLGPLTSRDFNRDSFSKSDTQLNASQMMPSFRENIQQPMHMYPKSSSADQLISGGMIVTDVLSIPQLDRGMFSDVDYDIEVAERVSRWEKYMKKRTDTDLSTIQEKVEQDMLPKNVRRSVYIEHNVEIPQSPVGPVSQSFTWSNLQTMKPSSSDPTIHLAGDPQLIGQANTHRMFQLIKEPVSGVRFHTATSAVSTFYRAPVPQRATGGLLTAAELREQMLANKDCVPAITGGDGATRAYRYMELDELQGAKSDTVKDLCRRFDLDFNQDDEELESSSTSKQEEDTDWNKLISDLEDKIKETEIWSPNMESNQGDMVSIERVKARTLQTIPFSEDPFWKEIEEMTSFEKMFNGSGLDDPITYRPHQLDYPHSQSHTLPTQPRTSSRDRMLRSKSLYTPNITPLTISVDKYSAPSALDDVLDDIRTSLEKSSPKVRKAGDSSDSHRSSPGPSFTDVNITSSARPRTYMEPSNNFWESAAKAAPAQGLLTYATQQQAPLLSSMQEYANVVNGNYQLDPNLLKQKLLNTGLTGSQQPGRIRPKPPPPLIIPSTTSFFPLTQPAPLKSQPPIPHSLPPSEEKINQVNQSMEDLRLLAKDVETKIGQIKRKLVTADEKNLDKILLTLRKFAPAASPKSYEPHQDSFQDFYVKKKSKLSDALSELERIYKSLNLEDESLMDRGERRDYPAYRSVKPPSITERPEPKFEKSGMSFQMSKPDQHMPEKRSEADFEAISKSFQAILDEVNQASAIMREPIGAPTMTSNIYMANQRPKTGPSPEPVRKILATQVSSVVFQPKPGIGVSPELQRKTMPVRTGIPRPVTLSVASPEPIKRGLKPISSTAKVVQPIMQTTVTQEPLRGASGKAFVPIPKNRRGLDDPQRQNLQANVNKLMSQPQSTQSSVSIVLKSPVSSAPPNSQMMMTTSASSLTSTTSSCQTAPSVTPKTRRSRGRFRPKNPDLVDDDVAVRKARSKSTPRVETQSTGVSPSPTTADYLKPRETSPPQSHIRLRPEKDADVMHDDMAYRSLRKDVPVEPVKLPTTVSTSTTTSSVEFQIKQPATPPSVLKFEKTFNIQAKPMRERVQQPSPQGSPKQRTVETQTQAGEMKKKTIHGRIPSSEKSDSKRKGGKFGRGVARMVEIFSSSDEERGRRSRPLHTRSAPDLTLEFDDDGDLLEGSMDNGVGSWTLGHAQTQTKVDMDRSSDQASDVSTPTSPSSKPPVHPLKKLATSPEKTSVPLVGRDVSEKSDLDHLDNALHTGRQGKSAEREVQSDSAIIDKPERPKSFHELLASFETKSNRHPQFKSLRKCASADLVVSEMVVQKMFHSEPYHSEPSLNEERRDRAPSREGAVETPASRNVICTAQSRMTFKSEVLLKVNGMCSL